jgi:hypothetical protein
MVSNRRDADVGKSLLNVGNKCRVDCFGDLFHGGGGSANALGCRDLADSVDCSCAVVEMRRLGFLLLQELYEFGISCTDFDAPLIHRIGGKPFFREFEFHSPLLMCLLCGFQVVALAMAARASLIMPANPFFGNHSVSEWFGEIGGSVLAMVREPEQPELVTVGLSDLWWSGLGEVRASRGELASAGGE